MPSRRLRRFFTPDAIEAIGDTVSLSGPDTDHLRRVLRRKEGDLCLVTGGHGLEAEAIISDLRGPCAMLRVQKILPQKNTEAFSLFVYPAFIQRGKMDELVRQMQELGVLGFFPIETERTIVKMQAQVKVKVAARWEKIAQEAAKQSGSLDCLKVDAPQPLKERLSRLPEGDTVAVFHPGAESIPFPAWVKKIDSHKPLHLFFGPEGGFSENEADLLACRGTRVGLGEAILKADTALLGTVAAVKFLFL